MFQRTRSGFTLIELMIVVSIIAIVAAIALPRLSSARLAANESNAIGILRTIATAENQLAASASIDTNGDGAGEYGYIGEMAGLMPARVSAGGTPAAGAVGIDELAPSSLVASMGNIAGSCVQRSGYLFQVWLPGAAVGGVIPAIAEDLNGGKLVAPFPDPENGATFWCAYAWPLSRGSTGNAVYFMNQTGQVLLMTNRGAVTYSGLTSPPPFDAAFTNAGDMSSLLALNGLVANDGNNWTPSK